MPSAIDTFVESVKLVKDNYWKMLAIYMLSFVIGLVFIGLIVGAGGLGALLPGSAQSTAGFILALAIIFILVALLIAPIFNGAYYSLAMQSMNKKGRPSLGKAFEDSKKVYKKMLTTFLIQITITIFVAIVLVLPMFIYLLNTAVSQNGAAALASGTGTAIVAMLITIAAVFIALLILYMLFFVAMPLAIIKNVGGIDAIKSSFQIGKRNFWSILGMLILLLVSYFVIYIAIEMVGFAVSMASPILGIALVLVFSIILSSFVAGVSGFLPIVFYKRYVGK